MPIYFCCIVLFIIWIYYQKNKSSNQEKEESKAFWDREYEANTTRRKDISSLDYITIPFDQLPFGLSENEEVLSVEKQIQNLKDKKILNLTGRTNTDLKLEYGTANIVFLSEYDNNFTLLVRNLQKWALLLYENHEITYAECILNYAICCNTDISNSYLLLAKIYKEQGNTQKIDFLIKKAETNCTLLKDAVLESLKEIQS